MRGFAEGPLEGRWLSDSRGGGFGDEGVQSKEREMLAGVEIKLRC